MKIIHRYVLREHVGPLTFSVCALTSLLLINYIAKRFGDLVGKGLPARVIAEFFVLSVPFTIAMTLPMSVLVATLYAFSRLAAENEITALKANGVSMVRLLVPVLIASSALSVAMIGFNDQVLPRANHRLRTLQTDIARKKPTFALREQIINEVSPGRFYLRANHLDQRTQRMREVTIYDLSDQMRRRTIYADSGEMAFAPNGNDLLLTLRKGYMVDVPKNEPAQLQRLYFSTDYVLVKAVANQLDLTTEDSYKSDREMSICELQNEVSRNEHDLDQARADLRQTLTAGAGEALSGSPAQPPQSSSASAPSFTGAPAPRSRHLTLGRVYCDAQQQLARLKLPRFALVRAASAFQTPDDGRSVVRGRKAATQDAAQGVPRRPDSAKTDTGKARADTIRALGDTGAARVDSVPVPPVTPPVVSPAFAAPSAMPVILSGTIEGSRVRMIDSRRLANQYAVELHKKVAISVACLVFVLIGAPVALRFPRGGVGLVIGVSLVVFAIYYIGLIAGEALADRDILTPFWAMWSANILFTGAGLLLLARMGRESATSRGGDLDELVEILRGIGRALSPRTRRERVEAGAV